MKRTIKFRGKSVGDLAPWIYGYYHYDQSTREHFICDEKSLFRYEVHGDSVGQFTGLLDRNSKEIYEGDIIIAANDAKCEIRFTEFNYDEEAEGYCSCIGFAFYTLQTKKYCGFGQSVEGGGLAYEVIGNIHDNADLLTEK